MKKSVGLILIVISLLFILTNLNNSKSNLLDNEPQIEITDPVYEYGILVDSFNLIHGVVKNGQTLGEILYANHINHQKIAEIVLKSKEIFDVRRVNPGKKYLVINSKDSIENA